MQIEHPNTFAHADAVLAQYNQLLHAEGAEITTKAAPETAHYPVSDTALAACLVTLGIPYRTTAPFTDSVDLDAPTQVNERRKQWWLGAVSATNPAHQTAELQVAWARRLKFENEHPLHPLVAMRAAIDARNAWVQAIAAFNSGAAILPTACAPGVVPFATNSLHAASVLRACGYEVLGFNRPQGSKGYFLLAATHQGVAAELVLQTAAIPGQTAAAWMNFALINYSEFLAHAKKGGQDNVVLRELHGDDTTLLLTAGATPKTKDKFFNLL